MFPRLFSGCTQSVHALPVPDHPSPRQQMSTASVDTTGFFEDSSHASADSIHFLRSNTMRLQPVTFTSQKIFLSLAAFRVLNALCLQTFFQPDEYFQSLEPAWQIVFGGDSGAWITWVSSSYEESSVCRCLHCQWQEWNFELRSSLHPVLFAVVYYIASSVSWLLHLSPLLSANFLIAAPKVTQAVIAAVGDYYTWKLAGRIYRPDSIVCWTTVRREKKFLHPIIVLQRFSVLISHSLRLQFSVPGSGFVLRERSRIALRHR